jgi:LPXTG-motif cell wall-anchored protein
LSQHPHDQAFCDSVTATTQGGQLAGTDPSPDTQTLAVTTGWSIEQTLILLVALVLIAVILVPGGLLSRRRRKSAR